MGKPCLVDESRYEQYAPANLVNMKDDYTQREENAKTGFVRRCQISNQQREEAKCALLRDLNEMERSWFGGRRRAKRIRKLREKWQEVIAASNPEPT